MPHSSFSEGKYIPGSDAESDCVFNFPYTVDEETIRFLNEHGRIMFIIRGPPGTAKDSLSRMLTQSYPNSKVYAADNYYQQTFTSSRREPNSLKLSHDFCQKKVENACVNNYHPIIVKNTHMKKSELQRYLDFAAQYNYTVIMAITTDKFKATPEILARSNSKGLSVEYFRNRLKAWRDVYPSVTGWFMSPDDSSYLLNQLQIALDFLLGDGKFCRLLSVYEKGDVLKCYRARKLLYCIAAAREDNSFYEIGSYCSSNEVKEHYGQCYTIVIEGYLVTPSHVSALVYLNEEMRALSLKPNIARDRETAAADDDSLIASFRSLNVVEGDNFDKHSATVEFDAEFKSTGRTNILKKCEENKLINIDHCGFMQLLCSEDCSNENGQLMSLVQALKSFSKKMAAVADERGLIQPDVFRELEGDYKVCRLSEVSWFIKPPSKLSFKTVFTGIYV